MPTPRSSPPRADVGGPVAAKPRIETLWHCAIRTTKARHRILRYWGGAMKQLDVTQPMEHELSDSEYKIVGTLRLA
jgi:hypothetical protein